MLLAGVAGADDFLGPSGVPFRGTPLSVFAEWEFLSTYAGSTSIPPVSFNSIGGGGSETLYAGFVSDADISGESWAWDLDGLGLISTGLNGANITFNVQNWVDNEPFKALVVQITYFDPSGAAPLPGFPAPHVVSVEGMEGQNPVTGFPFSLIPPDHRGGIHVAEHWSMEPNPDFENIVVFVPNGIHLNEVVIDTVSTPEPATLSLLIVGAAVMFRYRRRR